MKASEAVKQQISEDDIRDYAYHLYVQRGCADGHDFEDWLEAEACLTACIPKEASHMRLHEHTSGRRHGANSRKSRSAAG